MGTQISPFGVTYSLEYHKAPYDEKIVEAYLQVITPEDVVMINRWTSHADVPLPTLIAFSKKIKNIEPIQNLTVYRGIGSGLSYQEKMDMYDKKLFMHFLKPGIKVGSKIRYSTPRPLSFASDLATAKAFGSTIVTTVFGHNRNYINITDSFWEAVNRIDAASLFKEVILLDINVPITYTVLEV